MSNTEWLIVLAPIFYAIIAFFVEKLHAAKASLDAVIIGLIFSLIFSLYTEKIPEIRAGSGMMYSVSRDNPIYSTFEKASMVSKKLEEISDNTIQSIFKTQLQREINNLNVMLNNLSMERAVISRDDAMFFGTTALNSAKNFIDATSYVAPGNWWLNRSGRISTGGQDYIRSNAEAVKRGVSIRRIFIFSDKNEEKTMKSVLDANKIAGVDVYVTYADIIGGNAKADLILVDKKLAGELTLDPDTRKLERFEATYSSGSVEEIAKRINIIIRNAERYTIDDK